MRTDWQKNCRAMSVSSYRDIPISGNINTYPDSIPATPERQSFQALIIEDEVDICYLLKGILGYNNIKADYVNSLGEAERVLDSAAPPLVFLDNHLSDGLGVNYIRKVKAKHPKTKVIMITAHDTQTDRDLAFSEGVDLFIGKPFTKEIISNALVAVNL